MKFINGMRIIEQVLDSLIEYDQIKPQHAKIAKRILEDSHYGERKITTYLYDKIMELEEMVAISKERSK